MTQLHWEKRVSDGLWQWDALPFSLFVAATHSLWSPNYMTWIKFRTKQQVLASVEMHVHLMRAIGEAEVPELTTVKPMSFHCMYGFQASLSVHGSQWALAIRKLFAFRIMVFAHL